MGAIALAAIGGYLFVAARTQQGAVYSAVDDVMGEQVARFFLSALGGGLVFAAIAWMLGKAVG